MGNSDGLVIEHQKSYILELMLTFMDRDKVKNIAHLGLTGTNRLVFGKEGDMCPSISLPGKTIPALPALPSMCKMFPEAKHHYYDIENNNFDITEDWGIKGYDLVVCFRTAVFVKDKNHFFEQLKLCIKNNKHVVFDLLDRCEGNSDLSFSMKELIDAGVPLRHISYTYNPLKKHKHNYMYFSEEYGKK